MTDGHTAAGSWKVTVELTKDEVDQLIRSMDMARMMDGHADKPPLYPPDYLGAEAPMEVIAHRAFLRDILDKLYQSIKEENGQSKETQTN